MDPSDREGYKKWAAARARRPEGADLIPRRTNMDAIDGTPFGSANFHSEMAERFAARPAVLLERERMERETKQRFTAAANVRPPHATIVKVTWDENNRGVIHSQHH